MKYMIVCKDSFTSEGITFTEGEEYEVEDVYEADICIGAYIKLERRHYFLFKKQLKLHFFYKKPFRFNDK